MTKIWPVRTVVNRDVRLQIVGVRRKTVLKAQKVERERKAQAKAQTKAQLMARKEKEKESRRNMHRPSMKPERKKMPSMKRVMNPKMKRLTLLKNGVIMNSEPHDCGEWTKFNLDRGAAQTAIPKSWNAIQWTPGTTVTFKTASGELVPSEGTGPYVGSDENGLRCKITGPIANVHKPLVSAYECLSEGRLAVLDEHGGHVLPLNSAAPKDIQRILKKAAASEKRKWLKLHQERGIYNFYLQGKSPVDENLEQGLSRQRKDV